MNCYLLCYHAVFTKVLVTNVVIFVKSTYFKSTPGIKCYACMTYMCLYQNLSLHYVMELYTHEHCLPDEITVDVQEY